ncbi:MAG: hypothetical protein ACR2PL_27300, partial [Dehalococcoidia bacterium]
AWRVAMSARYLLAHGSYLPSRLPGYPVHDLAMAPLLRGGWLLTNSAGLLVSLIGVLLFARIVRRLAVPHAAMLTLTFAFLPLLWSTSVATLDYTWALTFLIGCYLAVLSERPILAGALLGLAGGCRISTLVFGLPFALLCFRQRPLREVMRFVVASALTWLTVFSPIWLRYGTQFWNFYDVRPPWGDVLHATTEGTIGLMPLAVLITSLLLSWRRLLQVPRLMRADPQANLWAMVVLLTLFIYARLPLQTYYLMPAAPFALLLLARLLRPRLLAFTCLALLLGGFVDVYTTSPSGWRTPLALLGLRPTAGLVLQDYRLRADRLTLVRRLRTIDLPEHSVVTTGFYFPMVAELYHDQLRLDLPEGYLFQVGPLTDNARATDGRDIMYVWLLTQGDARDLIRQGYRIYTLDFSRQTRRPVLSEIYLPQNERFGIH